MGEVAHLAAEAVNENKRGATALVQHVQAFGPDVEEAALRRDRALDSAHGERGEPHQRALETRQNQQTFDDPVHVTHDLPAAPRADSRHHNPAYGDWN